MSFANQVVIITGASSGIGWELARQLAAEGARVGLLARRRDRLEQLAAEIRAQGGEAAIAAADVAVRAEAVSALRSLRDQLGPVDLLIANAAVAFPTYVDQSNIDEVEKMFQVNVMGVIYTIEAILPEMLERRRGHIAGVASLAAYRGLPGEGGYCATKAAVASYLEALRLQLRSRGIHVTTICPGFVHTPMTEVHTFKMPFVMNVDEAARRIIRGLRRKARVWNFPWQTTFLIKLSRWLPERMVARWTLPYVKNPPPRLSVPAVQEAEA